MVLLESLSRPSWNKTFMDECELHGMRSTCLRRKVGAVAVRDKRVLATGYNGAAMQASTNGVPVRFQKDEETRLLHLAHQACSAMMALENTLREIENPKVQHADTTGIPCRGVHQCRLGVLD